MEFSRVEVITGISKITALQKALGKFRISGMTVYQVLGCGVQHGTQEFEIDERKDIQLLPTSSSPHDLWEPAEQELRTGPSPVRKW